MQDLARSYDLARAVARAARDMKALDVVAIDVHDRLPLVDVFVIASADNERLVRAVADACDDELARLNVHPRRVEGADNRRWVLIDAGAIVVHVFHTEEREHYDLERLWRDSPRVELPEGSL